MSIILPNHSLRAQLPQSRIMVTTRRDQIRAIGTKRAIPDPALVAVECRLQREGVWSAQRTSTWCWSCGGSEASIWVFVVQVLRCDYFVVWGRGWWWWSCWDTGGGVGGVGVL